MVNSYSKFFKKNKSPLSGIRGTDLYPDPNYKKTELDEKLDNLLMQAKMGNYNSAHGHIGYEALYDPALTKVQQVPNDSSKFSHGLDNSLYNYGESSFDKGLLLNPTQEDIQNNRANNQPWYSKVANGVLKGGVTAATTALEGLGLLYGIGQGIYDAATTDEKGVLGKAGAGLHGFWDNPVTNALKNINDWSEEALPNYYSTDEQENPLSLRNVFSANTLGDKLIKNFGFMVGAFYGGIPLASGLGKLGIRSVKAARNAAAAERLGMETRIAELTEKAAGDTNKLDELLKAEKLTDADKKERILEGFDKIRDKAKTTRATTQLLGGLGSAINEGAVEAINNSNDWANLERQKAYDNYQKQLESIKKNYGGTEIENQLKVQVADDYNKTLKEIERGKARMGNADLLLNIPILMASNLYQYGRLYSRGFDSTKRELSSFWNGHKLAGILEKGTLKSDKNAAKGIISAFLKPISEGNEEFLQRAASDGAGNAVSASIDRFVNSDKSQKATNDANDFILGFGKAFADNLHDESAWDEFAMGFASSFLGMPVFGKQTKNAWLGKGAPVGIAGGVIGSWQDYNDKMNHEKEVANYLNERVKEPKFKEQYRNIIRHGNLDDILDKAISDDDKAFYKEVEFEQLVNDINAAASSGHLEEFKQMIGYNDEYTPEELADIVKNTTRTVSADEQKESDQALHKFLTQEKIKYEAKEDHTDEEKENYNNIVKAMDEIQGRLDADDYKDKEYGPFINASGQMDVQTDKNGVKGGEMIDILNNNRQHLLDTIDELVKIRNDIDIETDGKLSDKDINLPIQMRAKIWDFEQRSGEMAYDVVNTLTDIPDIFNNYKKNLDKEVAKTKEDYEQTKKDYEEAKKNSSNEEEIKRLEIRKNKLEQAVKDGDIALKGASKVNELLGAVLERKKTTSEEKEAFKKGYGDNTTIDRGVGKVNKWLGINKEYTQSADERMITDDELESIVSDPNNLRSLARVIEVADSNMSRATKNRLQRELYDLYNIQYQKLEYRKKLNELLGNPDLINEAYKAAETKLSEEEKDNKVNELSLKIKNAQNMTELDRTIRDAANVDSEITKAAIDKAKHEAGDEKKKFFASYEHGVNMFNSFMSQARTLPNEEASAIMGTAASAWEYALNEGTNPHDTFISSMQAAANDLEKEGNPENKPTVENIRKILSDISAAADGVATNVNVQKTTVKKGTSSKEEDEKADDDDRKAAAVFARRNKQKQAQQGTDAQEQQQKPDESAQAAAPERAALEKDITDAINNSKDKEGNYAISSIAELPQELQDSVKTYNDSNKDNPIDDKYVATMLDKMVDNDTVEYGEALDSTDDENNADVDASNNIDEGSQKSKKMKERLRTSYGSSNPTKYRNGLYYKVPYVPEKSSPQTKAVQDFLDKQKAYSFVDENYLGYIYNEAKKKDKDVPVYFIGSKSFSGDHSPVFLAVKWDSDAKAAVRKRAFNNANTNLANEAAPITIGDSQYQIVGVLNVDNNAVDEVKNSYSKLQSKLHTELSEKLKNNGGEYAVSDLSTNITSINTGRLDKYNDENDTEDDKVSLQEFMTSNQGNDSRAVSSEWNNGNKFQFAVNVGESTKFIRHNDQDVKDKSDYEEPNSIVKSGANGAILLYVPRPDGRMYPVRCTRRTVGKWLNSTVDGTTTGSELLDKVIHDSSVNPFLGEITDNLKKLLDPESSYMERLSAKGKLPKFFVFGAHSPIGFDGDEVHLTLPTKDGKNKVYTVDGDTIEDRIHNFFNILANNNILFTVPLKSQADSRDIIKSGIMEIGLRGFYNFNANFTVKPIDENGNAVEITSSVDVTGSNNFNPATVVFSVGDGKQVYKIYVDGKGENRVAVDGKPLNDTKKENIILQAWQCKKSGQKVAYHFLSKYDEGDTKNALKEALKEYDDVYYITTDDPDNPWIYDGRIGNVDLRLYPLNSDQGKKLSSEINKKITSVTETAAFKSFKNRGKGRGKGSESQPNGDFTKEYYTIDREFVGESDKDHSNIYVSSDGSFKPTINIVGLKSLANVSNFGKFFKISKDSTATIKYAKSYEVVEDGELMHTDTDGFEDVKKPCVIRLIRDNKKPKGDKPNGGTPPTSFTNPFAGKEFKQLSRKSKHTLERMFANNSKNKCVRALYTALRSATKFDDKEIIDAINKLTDPTINNKEKENIVSEISGKFCAH